MSRGKESRRQQLNREAKQRRRKTQKRVISSQSQSLSAALDEAHDLLDRGDRRAADLLLRAQESRHAQSGDALKSLLSFYFHAGDPAGCQRIAARLLKLSPTSAEFLPMHAGACMQLGFYATAIRDFERFVTMHPQHPQAETARKTLADLLACLQVSLHESEMPTADVIERSADNERLQMLLQFENDVEIAVLEAEKIAALHPGYVPILNNLSQLYFLAGDSAKALALSAAVLEQAPGDLHALSNRIRYQLVEGDESAARATADQLLALPNDRDESRLKKAEGMSYLGRDEDVLAQLGEDDPASLAMPPAQRAMFAHLTAVAAARQGNARRARQLWKTALTADPNCDLARTNLNDLDARPDDANGPWAYVIQHWLSLDLLDKLMAPNNSPTADFGAEMRDRLRRHPSIKFAALIFLDRGDDFSREFAIRIAAATRDQELLAAMKEFAVSRRGTVERRTQALHAAFDAELLEAKPQRFWIKGNWQEVLLQPIQIRFEPDPPTPGLAHDFYAEAMQAGASDDHPRAIELYRQALEISPDDPKLLNNLASELLMSGQATEAQRIIDDNFARNPDYLFARLTKVNGLVFDRRLNEARELLFPVRGMRDFQVSEFSAWSAAIVNFHLAAGERDEAERYLDLWKMVYPDDPQLPIFRRRFEGGILKRLLKW